MKKGSARVLHVPYTFFPDEPGGTEVYVSGLVEAIRRHGFDGIVAAPGKRECNYDYKGMPVYRFKIADRPLVEHAYGVPDEVAAKSFCALLDQVQPDIVHMHAFTSAVSENVVDASHARGARVFFTYHTPTVSCLRGTMMLMGSTPCDGVLEIGRCAACTLQKHGMPVSLGNALTRIPQSLVKAVVKSGLRNSGVTALRMPEFTAGVHQRFQSLMHKADRVVAVSQWVMDVLLSNGVPEGKLMLCRQGLGAVPTALNGARNPSGERTRPLRLSYFGRLDPVKGVDIIIDALKLIPDSSVALDVYGVVQPGLESYAARLKQDADPRVHFHPPLPPEAVPEAMTRTDFVAIPSRWLETGPLVVYEAFAAGTPVLGSRLGGIAELVTDGVDGILVASDEPRIWAQTIFSFTRNPDLVSKLRLGIRPPRTMAKVAEEMAGHYETALAMHV